MVKYLMWFLGVVLIVRGITGLNEPGAAAGVVVATIMGILILPPVWARLPLPDWARWVAFICGVVAGNSFTTPSKSIVTAEPVQVVASEQAPDAVRDLVIKKEEWEKGGFGTIGIHSFTVHNKSATHSYKDVSFAVRYMGASGSEINRTVKTVYQSFPAGKTVRVKELNTGFIDAQAQKAAISVEP